MFKQALPILLGVLLGYIGGMQAVGHAQFYAGGSVSKATEYGIGSQPDHGAHDGCSKNSANLTHDEGSLFVGYRAGKLGLEAGSGSLFHMHYAADCPWNLFTQDVDASYRYARVNAYIPITEGFELVPFVGAAIVKFTNFEDANLRAPYFAPEHLTNLTTGKQVSNFFGLGIEKKFSEWFVRGEFQQMNRVAEDPWTARGWHNTVQTVSVGIGRYF